MLARGEHGVDGRIRLSQDSGTPIYIQLADQLKYLIGTGEFGPGTRLPAARHLAANLRINRNTVLSAYALLAEEGYVSGRRGGGTVVASSRAADIAESHFSPKLLSIVDQLVERAAGLGLTPEQMGALVASHARIKDSVASLQVCFVECNPHSLDHYVGQIRREFDVSVLPVLLRDLGTVAERGDLPGVDCIVSTFFHLSEVRRVLRHRHVDAELLAIAVRPHLSMLDQLERLPRGSAVGVAYLGDDEFAVERLQRMTEAVEHTGLRHMRVHSLLLPAAPEASAYDGMDALVVRPDNIAAVRSTIPRGVRVIEFLNEMDAASREFLRDVFNDLRSRRTASLSAVTMAVNGHAN
jgi:GntR family transcriptional regulator